MNTFQKTLPCHKRLEKWLTLHGVVNEDDECILYVYNTDLRCLGMLANEIHLFFKIRNFMNFEKKKKKSSRHMLTR